MDDYTNIIELARRADFKKIMIKRNSWSYGSNCIVNQIVLKDNKDETYCAYVLGHIKYSNGTRRTGVIECANTYAWRTIKVFEDEEIKVVKKGEESK